MQLDLSNAKFINKTVSYRIKYIFKHTISLILRGKIIIIMFLNSYIVIMKKVRIRLPKKYSGKKLDKLIK